MAEYTYDKQYDSQRLSYTEQEKSNALDEASLRIRDLEDKINILESRVPKHYPEVKFLNYLTRKRILVRSYIFF